MIKKILIYDPRSNLEIVGRTIKKVNPIFREIQPMFKVYRGKQDVVFKITLDSGGIVECGIQITVKEVDSTILDIRSILINQIDVNAHRITKELKRVNKGIAKRGGITTSQDRLYGKTAGERLDALGELGDLLIDSLEDDLNENY